MLRFRLGAIPVEVHFSHLAISAVLGWSMADAARGGTGWPADAMRAGGDSQYGGVFVAVVGLWVLVIGVSVLVHELGHALTARSFGFKPSIHLVGMGGLTQPNATGPIVWWRNVLLTLAGPSASLVLGLAALAASKALTASGLTQTPEWVMWVLESAASANFFWTVLNLVPVPPLDGGQISSAVLVRLLGRAGLIAAHIVAMLFAGTVVLAGVLLKWQVLSLLFLFYGFRSGAMLYALVRAEKAAGAPHPLDPLAVEAENAYQAGQLDHAAQLARNLLAQTPTPMLSARAHHVLGWVALKRGAGPEALSHFAQVQGIEVAPHAVAAAFSLSGDEARALPLWEEAHRRFPDPLIRHEYGGALVRAGREADMRAIPQVRPALAFVAAERVHFLRGELERAAAAARAAYREEPTAPFAYDAACAAARLGQKGAAMELLHLARQHGFADRATAEHDPDLKSVSDSAEFRAWLGSLEKTSPA